VRPLGETEAAWVPAYFGEDYLRLYQFPPERTDPEVDFLRAILHANIAAGEWVLDLACGQGRHAVPLAGAGLRIVGLDYQLHLLREAACQAAAQDVPLSLVRGDMRRLPFGTVFGAVINIFTAFGYFSDAENAAVLDEVARVLLPGGWFILDVANRDALVRHAQTRSWKRLLDGTFVISEWQWDVALGRYLHWQCLRDARGERTYTHSVRVYTCSELTDLLTRAGFRVDSLYGGFRGEALTLDASRLIIVAQKV